MSDLSRSLVDAAAEAMCEAAKIQFQMSDSDPMSWEPWDWQPEARVAVAAVLETLADTARYEADFGGEVWYPAALRGLAVAVREDG